MVVLCSNVSAHDIQHLIPKCDGANAGKGPCMRLAAEKTQLAREADKCDGRECANNDEDLCRDGDEMNCKLLRKIKDYLRKQFLLATSKQWKNATKKVSFSYTIKTMCKELCTFFAEGLADEEEDECCDTASTISVSSAASLQGGG